jgi:tetratricopeptide (TPR) repeat protein
MVPADGKPVLEYFSAHLGGRLVEAYTAAQRLLATYPGHLQTATIAAWTARDIGRPQEALNVLRPFTPDPRVNAAAWRGWVETTAQAYHMLARYEDEQAFGAKALERVPGTPVGYVAQARALATQGRMDELGKVLEARLTGPPSARPTPGEVLVTAASELRTHGHVDGSRRVADQALRWFDGLDTKLSGSPLVQLQRGSALTLLERWPDAAAAYAKVVSAVPSALTARSEIGVIAAHRRNVATARKVIDELAQMNRPYVRGAHTFARARVAAALGDREKTVDLLREAFAEGQPLAWPVHDDYAFEPVRGYAPFETLVAIK